MMPTPIPAQEKHLREEIGKIVAGMLNEQHGASPEMLSRFGKLSPYDAEEELAALVARERSADRSAMEKAKLALARCEGYLFRNKNRQKTLMLVEEAYLEISKCLE